jgi:pimeloyl-ACP methyl ester carboxylesterase
LSTKRVVDDGQVRTAGRGEDRYDEHGAGQPLVLLHGGLVDARFFEPNLAPLAERFHVYTPEIDAARHRRPRLLADELADRTT